MCYDISFSSNIELIADYIPGVVIDPQLSIDFDTTIHVQAQAFRKYPIILFEDDEYKMRLFEWGVIADYMNTPEKIKQGRLYFFALSITPAFGLFVRTMETSMPG